MQNVSPSLCGSTRPRPISCCKRDAELIAQRAQVLFDQAAVEAVVSGRHRRVRGEDRVLGDFAQGVVEAQAVVVHPLANRFERGERAVPFVQVIDARRDAQRPQRSHAADAEHQLLANSRAMVAAVQPAGQLAIFRAVSSTSQSSRYKLHAADVHQPDLGEQRSGARVDPHGDRLAIGADRRLHRHVLDLGVEIFLVLIAVDVEVLLEIALVVEQTDRHQRHAQAAGALDMVAGEHAQAAGVNRHRFVNAELGGEVGDRLRAQHAGVRAAPGVRGADVFLQPAIGLVDAAVEHQLGGAHFQPLGRELGQQRDRVVIQLPPADRVEIAEQVDDFGVPAPPQVVGDREHLS